jgi:tetratricopeptide (TPR) repeat protein
VATVFIARGVPDATFEVLRLGCAAQDAQVAGVGLPGLGLHLLHGLVLATRNKLDEAKAELARELAGIDRTLVYGRECEANTLYAIGALALREGDIAGAEAAFARTLAIAPRHVGATAALRREIPPSANALDRALAEAIILTLAGRHAEAAHLYRDALLRTPPGSAGWGLPVEPVLNPLARIDVWAEALAIIRARAI